MLPSKPIPGVGAHHPAVCSADLHRLRAGGARRRRADGAAGQQRRRTRTASPTATTPEPQQQQGWPCRRGRRHMRSITAGAPAPAPVPRWQHATHPDRRAPACSCAYPPTSPRVGVAGAAGAARRRAAAAAAALPAVPRVAAELCGRGLRAARFWRVWQALAGGGVRQAHGPHPHHVVLPVRAGRHARQCGAAPVAAEGSTPVYPASRQSGPLAASVLHRTPLPAPHLCAGARRRRSAPPGSRCVQRGIYSCPPLRLTPCPLNSPCAGARTRRLGTTSKMQSKCRSP